MLERAATGMAFKDATGRYRWANDAFAAIHRVAPAVVLGATDADLVDPFAAAGRQARDALARERGRTVQFQEIVTDALEGRIVALAGEIVPLDGDGGVGVMLRRAGDRDGLHPTVPTLHERLATVERTGRTGSFELDLHTGRARWSDEMFRLFGLTQRETMTLDEALESILPEDREAVRAELEQAVTELRPFATVYRVQRGAGDVRVIQAQGHVVCDEHGRPVTLVGTIHDVTERQQAEAEVRRVVRQLELILESIEEGIVGIAADGTVTTANEAAARMVDLTVDELVGRNALHGPPAPPAEAVEMLGATLEDGETRRIDRLRLCRRLVVEVTVAPLREEGGPAGAVVTMLDRTDQERYEVALRESLDALERANAHRDRLLAGIVESQELERQRIAADIHDDSVQVMSAVGLRLERAAMQARDGSPVALDALRRDVREATARLRRLLFSVAPPELESGIGPALERTVAPLAEEAGFDFRLEDRLLPQPTVETRMLVYRIAQEALMNAYKHARAKTVQTRVCWAGNGVLLEVRDDGVGAEPERFERLPDGHLGVATMRYRAEMAGGWCTITSAPGEGTTVEAWLPAEHERASERAA
ncbi:MAG TPA: PAS domain-containing protein [Solirubrobacteraceae bacterium]|nr:PAS domain-containing protein [Solirubrobacteraceae bacterium]